MNCSRSAEIRIFAIGLLLFFPGFLFAQSQPPGGAPDKTVQEGDGIVAYEYDTNHDGKIDLIVRLDSNGAKVAESIDFNHDGRMDDFYHYKKGVLVSEQVDTNFDGRIDLWVWLSDGIYVTKYERDVNFDGKPDIVKVFGDRGGAKDSGASSK